MKKYLVTGGAGFIGSNFVNRLFNELSSKESDFEIHCIDKLTYAGNLANISKEARESKSFVFHEVDINSTEVDVILGSNQFEYGINFAAESHVDRSIDGPAIFVTTNVLGTTNLLNAWRSFQNNRFIQIGTDEVYGSLQVGFANEQFRLMPSSPYSASKASADLIALSYRHTYGMDVIVTRCSNNYGPNQNSEKLIPKMIEAIQANHDLQVYGDGSNVREWIHVGDHVSAIMQIATAIKPQSSVYNIGTGVELTNLQIIKLLQDKIKYSESKVKFIADRPGHDFRYAIDSRLLREEFGWKPAIDLNEGLDGLISL
ncbi:dTDP-glucose 4,6-dehydratase [Candidatus Planktophila sulfonica]|uniref:dTDP-glucose 4,6-dehydratase n=1 Tax=Candidatus Planktophila sulfonica TaxID=1884904 RepID=A0A249KEZ5_9ACTN|nr:dTDP-glucose 4,6-dehydratase [Candidatus Planktophila sulfonica]ASY15373.1 dTDP-glucose 4,6-dehydratase [Candidatus Planktophila sulfonica]